jgi:hypothetical protein
LEAFKLVTAKTHTEQAKWWLNGCNRNLVINHYLFYRNVVWEDGASKYAEDMWNFVALMQETETGQKKLYGKRKVEVKEGCDLDEHKAHVFLERLGETLTVTALRKRLKELDVDMNKVCYSTEKYVFVSYCYLYETLRIILFYQSSIKVLVTIVFIIYSIII